MDAFHEPDYSLPRQQAGVQMRGKGMARATRTLWAALLLIPCFAELWRRDAVADATLDRLA